ncbi:MAG: hydantoinase/oxoprolinase family protein [Desulfovibrio sp.]
MGANVCVVPGGLDHRGVEVSPLRTAPLPAAVREWEAAGVAAVACVGKFSPRNAAHELAMSEAVRSAAPQMSITAGHRLSGRLNFPRRMATAYFNAAVQRLHNEFLDAVEVALAEAGITASVRLLKADGGAVPLPLSRREPVQSILSGPAASVMGVLALCGGSKAMRQGCSLLLDMGGTTTDMALFVDGSPVVDRDGMLLKGRRTLVRALASVSIGVGGDSLLTVDAASGTARPVQVGPLREGPAMAFGGSRPTLLDALNVLNAAAADRGGVCEVAGGDAVAGDVPASIAGIAALAEEYGLSPESLAQMAADDALAQVAAAARTLTDGINARPIYTLAALKAVREARPQHVWLVGGPAACVARRMSKALNMPVETPAHADVANAVGAALTLPTDALELYADTGRCVLTIPALELTERVGKGYSLSEARQRASALLRERLEAAGVSGARVEVTEADIFATLDDAGFGSKDIRVVCQVVPGLSAKVG